MRFVKGEPRHEKAGRKQGTPNKSTAIRREAAKIDDLDKRHAYLMNKSYELATTLDSIGAIRIWFEQYHATRDHVATEPIIADIKTLDDVDNTSELIVQQMLRKELSLSIGERLMDALAKKRANIEARLTPIVQKLVDEQEEQLKAKT